MEDKELYSRSGHITAPRVITGLVKMGILKKRKRKVWRKLNQVNVDEYYWPRDPEFVVLSVKAGRIPSAANRIDKPHPDLLEHIIRREIKDRDGWDYVISKTMCRLVVGDQIFSNNNAHISIPFTRDEVIEYWNAQNAES